MLQLLSFQIESWAAIAPGIDDNEAWKQWLIEPYPIAESDGKIPLKQIPPLLRRRFNTLGKCAVAAVFKLIKENESMQSIFASRHGDTSLTLSLLEDIGRDEPMSPTGFSLAVHNAVSGLYSIARRDTSAVTAIAAMEGLVIPTLLEAIGQLQDTDRVLCVIYDVPLPTLYGNYTSSSMFPYAIAMVLSRTVGQKYTLNQHMELDSSTIQKDQSDTEESMLFLKLLTGLSLTEIIKSNDMSWSIKKAST